MMFFNYAETFIGFKHSSSINGEDYFSCDRYEYSEETEGVFVYNDLRDNLQLKYYPSQNHDIVMQVYGEETTYHMISSEEALELEESKKAYYITDDVKGDDLSVKVLYAYTVKEYGYLQVKILCDITNISNKEMFFEASDYFKLNNQGILKSGYCDYDYSELGAGASFQTLVNFRYPETANAGWWNMTLSVEERTVYLQNDYQRGEELEGIYFDQNKSICKSIIHLYGNNYRIIHYNDILEEMFMKNVVLNSDNTLTDDYGNKKYSWSPEAHSVTETYDYNLGTLTMSKY